MTAAAPVLRNAADPVKINNVCSVKLIQAPLFCCTLFSNQVQHMSGAASGTGLNQKYYYIITGAFPKSSLTVGATDPPRMPRH